MKWPIAPFAAPSLAEERDGTEAFKGLFDTEQTRGFPTDTTRLFVAKSKYGYGDEWALFKPTNVHRLKLI